MGEFNDLKSRIHDSDEFGRHLSKQVSGEIDSLQGKLKNLEEMRRMGSENALGDATVNDLDSKMNKMQKEINNIKVFPLN